MKELNYPFDVDYLLKNKKKIIAELDNKEGLLPKRIAILGGSTTSEIKRFITMFLLNFGIRPLFYESEYNKYYEDAVFDNPELEEFDPDIVYICTCNKNILNYPNMLTDKVDDLLEEEFTRYKTMWDKLFEKYNTTIIQNNFEYPFYRLLGNMDAVNPHGKINFITRLNQKFYDYANSHKNFFICDINYISSCYGLDKWFNNSLWHLYKYALDIPAIPYLAFNVASIIKSIYGKNKKAFVLDLDNTLWGGIIGDDGVDNIEIGPETALGETFSEFQSYLGEHKNIGVILNINSKNEYENAISGLKHPSSILRQDDFIIIKANWNPKNLNTTSISEELNLGADSFVFVDDNPAERKVVGDYIDGIGIPEINLPENFIRIIDRNNYFEVTNFSKEDLDKTKSYQDNAKRSQMMANFDNYDDYLKSLKMKAEICSFKDVYLERISQLSNKSNQFNLTTKRYSLADIENVKESDDYIKIYGKLSDIFGDNGVVSVVIGSIKGEALHIDLWIMSCRVLKRNMEYAMMDELVIKAKEKGIRKIFGYYYPTVKNKMVKNFYENMGFRLIDEEDDGDKTYMIDVPTYEFKNELIEVNVHD